MQTVEPVGILGNGQPDRTPIMFSGLAQQRSREYVEAAMVAGYGPGRILGRHIIPNAVGPLVVLVTLDVGNAIITFAGLSFLGLGVPEPYPSWGRMLSVSAAEYAQKAPWLVLFPGLAISLAVFGSNLLGDGLRDIVDPQRRT